MTTAQDTKDQARQTASTAADESKRVANVVGDEAHSVAGEVKDQARGLLDDALGQLDEQSRTQLDSVVRTLHGFGGDLDEMASAGGSGLATQLARQVADRSRTIEHYLDGRRPAVILDDVRGLARRRPAVFLLGALGAGVIVGRLARGAKQAGRGGEGSGTATSTRPGVTTDVHAEEASQISAPSSRRPATATGLEGRPTPSPETPTGHRSGAGPQGNLP